VGGGPNLEADVEERGERLRCGVWERVPGSVTFAGVREGWGHQGFFFFSVLGIFLGRQYCVVMSFSKTTRFGRGPSEGGCGRV
jgi:hypothetical protein